MSSSRHVVGMALGTLVLSLVPVRVDAQRIVQKEARPMASIEGVDTFKAYCSVCHGQDAKGNGPAATALKKAPADLTMIAKRNGGKFSPTDVEGVILGTQVLVSHGSRDMPIWGPIFKSTSGSPEVMTLRVTNLVKYLQSLQVP